MNNDCLFCKIIDKKIPADIVYEDDYIMGFNDLSPQAPVHILFIPKKHIAVLNDLSSEDSVLIGKIIFKIKEIAIDKGLSEDGYRVVSNCNKDAGQEVFHVHFHLLGGRKFSWPPG